MKLVNEDIILNNDNCFSHSVWDEHFLDQEYITKDEIKDFEALYECTLTSFQYEDGDNEEYEDVELYMAENPLEIWPLEMDTKEDVLLGYYMTGDGYIQIWATEIEE